jgi:uncharacterized protein
MKSRSPLRWIAACALLALTVPAAAVTVRDIPTPRPNGWVVDLAGTLPPTAIGELNRIGDRVKHDLGAEMAVVVVPDTSGAPSRTFAVELFNHWGIGDAGADNGLLLFVAINDRVAEIVLGDGIDSAQEQRASEEIMDRTMLPRFRQGEPARAIVDGARECAERILGLPGAAAAEPLGVRGSPAGATVHTPASADGPVEALPGARPTAPAGRRWLAPAGVVIAGCVAALAAVALWLAKRPKRCPSCGATMVVLDEARDDDHLSESAQVEERIGSVDYRVWWCAACRKTETRRHSRWFSSYRVCPGCAARTLRSSTTTLEEATQYSGGLARVDEVCVHCDHSSSREYATPRLPDPDDSSSSSSSSGSGFGGGSSSGGGSSGSW